MCEHQECEHQEYDVAKLQLSWDIFVKCGGPDIYHVSKPKGIRHLVGAAKEVSKIFKALP